MRLGLLGYPVSHSVSPAMQTAALAAAGLTDWRYEALPTPPEQVEAAVKALRAGDFAGVNVTVPHKQAVLPYLDELTPVAQAIGAVNTVVVQRDPAGGPVRLVGHNTDAPGLLADLRAWGVPVERKRVMVLGAGGSARAAVAACAGAGAHVRVMARRHEQADELKVAGHITYYPWTRLGLIQASDNCRLILNCTPLGMSPNVDASPWLETAPWPAEAFVYDLVYNPPETVLVRQARRAGLKAVTGLGMLVEQGALAFELWTGRAPDRAVMRAAAEQALAHPQPPASAQKSQGAGASQSME